MNSAGLSTMTPFRGLLQLNITGRYIDGSGSYIRVRLNVVEKNIILKALEIVAFQKLLTDRR
jgi:hypothetical protein